MATPDDRPGFWSKVAMLVRNPARDRSALARTEPEQEIEYDKHALKAIIERKRKNDVVRKREFDQLRKLRNLNPLRITALARSSAFESSIGGDHDGRAVTLKKIDEIEAQMSKQWWKGKQGGGGSHVSPVSSVATLSAALSSHSTNLDSNSDMSANHSSEYAPTQVGAGMPLTPSHAPLGAPMAQVHPDRDTGDDVSFPASRQFAIEVDAMTTDAELEEAAIRFANGDDVGAEASLRNALQNANASRASVVSWATALMDLYRATHQRARFDSALVELSHVWDGAVLPVWFDFANGASSQEVVTPASRAGVSVPDRITWRCPHRLTELSMEDLRESMATQPTPWLLDWSALESIDGQAMPLLAGMFGSLCDEAVALRFSGADRLLLALAGITPSGHRTVDPAWWKVRLNALRSMKMLDAFERVALDYRATYEMLPPAWTPARCDYAPAEASPSLPDGGGVSEADAVSTLPLELENTSVAILELSGHALGDVTHALGGAPATYDGSMRMVVSCRKLIRVDFAAAGSILDWASQRESEGHLVQFREVHRLVAAFFHVIGIHEHAKVTLRSG